MSRFYVTLASSVCSVDYFPDNTLTNIQLMYFKTSYSQISNDNLKLYEVTDDTIFELEEHIDTPTVKKETDLKEFIHTQKSYYAVVKRGLYRNLDLLFNYINSVITMLGDKLDKQKDVLPKLTKTNDDEKVIVNNGYRAMYSPIVLNMSDTLWRFLGYDAKSIKQKLRDHMFQCFKRLIRTKRNTAGSLSLSNSADSYFDIQRIRSHYVYSDVVKPSFVGDSYSQLLRVCEVPPVDQYSKQITIPYTNPFYIPVSQNEFDLIKIDLKDDTGKNIEFQYGRVILTLEFKQNEKKPILINKSMCQRKYGKRV